MNKYTLDLITYSGVIKKQEEELNVLFRYSGYLNAYSNAKDVLQAEKDFNLEKYGAVSTLLYKRAFKGIKSRSFAVSPTNPINLEQLINKKKTDIENLFLFQEKEIKNLFNRVLFLLKKISNENRHLFYLWDYDFISIYLETQRHYFFDVYMPQRDKIIEEKRPCDISDKDMQTFTKCLKKIGRIYLADVYNDRFEKNKKKTNL